LLALRQASVSNVFARRKRKGDEVDNDAQSKTADLRKTRGAGKLRTSLSDTGADRLMHLQAQLPLQRGRKVAFCQPPRADALPGEGGEWILATVIDCVNDDKQRYVVQDAEDEGASGPYVAKMSC